MLLAVAPAVGGVTVELDDRRVVPGRYAAVAFEGPPMKGAITTRDGFAVRWPHRGGRVVLPVLVPDGLGQTWTIDVNGEAIDLAVEPVAEQLPLRPILPRAYDAVAAWEPTRPRAHRMTLFLVFAAAIVGITVGRQRRVKMIAAVVAASLLALLVLFRPSHATRFAQVEGASTVEWTFFKSFGTSNEAAVAIDGLTLPVAFSPNHLQRLRPTLQCAADGTPLSMTVQLEPGGTAALARQVDRPATQDMPTWATPLRRYSR